MSARSLSHKTIPIFTKFYSSDLNEPIPVAGLRECAIFLFMGLRIRSALGHGSLSAVSVACWLVFG